MGERHEPLIPVKQIPAADWTDMDLLTRSLAGVLLEHEITSETATLAQIQTDESLSDIERAGAVELHTRRIDAMRERRDDLATDPAPSLDP